MPQEAMCEAMTSDKRPETNQSGVETTTSSITVATQTSQSNSSRQANASDEAASTSNQSALRDSGDHQSQEEHATAPSGIQPPDERLEQYNIAVDEAEEQQNAKAVEKREQEHERKFDLWKYDSGGNCPWAHDSEVRSSSTGESDKESHKSVEDGHSAKGGGGKAADMAWLHL